MLIDGVEVQAGNNAQITTNKNNISTNKTNIKNLGEGVAGSTALTAALSALPQTSKESKLSCGVGTGAYSSRYAIGFGCASKVNERVDINAGGSYVFGGSKSYGSGTLESGVVKAGFVFKLGGLKKPTQISMKEKESMEEKIYSLEEKNKKIISQNKNLATKNQTIIAQNKALLSRLERLEKITLIGIKSKDLAVYKLN
ncbi:YadA C-terminal domain-containing protein [Prochlorococcus marinus]|uniref:YadA C-terminal domain-containing protein n=1 Tax=Prochlorococcus marinus TaxID=1219 RepID=UPI00094DE2CA|nr:YadA C-terminal domain-containing protein [Prochlorococcus marinus]